MPKRLFGFFFLFSCIVLETRGQSTIGVQAGPDFPRLVNILRGYNAGGGAVSKNSQAITRFYGGFLANIPLDKKQCFILRPSLLYVGAGGETPLITDFNGNLISSKTDYKFDYFQLPVQLLFSPKLSFGRPWIGGGLYGGVLIHASATTSAGSEDLVIGGNQGNLKRFDLGYVASAGITSNFGLLVGVDFRQSLGTIISDPPSGSPAVRNSAFGIHIGYVSSIGGH